ncbi:MAG: hypothetical protein KIT77_25960 [Caldilinea sp.]|nr:hypothetical protein [Caldilinea sp.]MCB0149024.1 hypothetical protein [Caldilineaceae bacterium]MCW5844724.1 hypothetical protein [Caldilinea sp.]
MSIDRLAAERAQAVVHRARGVAEADALDNTVTKTLGVLQENGVYAAFLFLLSRTDTEKPRAEIVRGEALQLLGAMGFAWDGERAPASSEQVLSYVTSKVTAGDTPEALERQMLAKEALEQMLTYARYGAKAWSAETA